MRRAERIISIAALTTGAAVGLGLLAQHSRGDEANSDPSAKRVPRTAAPATLKNIILRQRLPGGLLRIVSVSDTQVLHPGDPGWIPDPGNRTEP